MNRFKKYICAVIAIFIVSINIVQSNAYDNGYYIKNMDVAVEVNDKREFKITETIDVYFNTYRHGIIRKIPKSSSLEKYKIKDLSVKGAKYEVSKDTDYQIKIGDANEDIIGDKQYIIEYTLAHYKDSEEDGDYLYLNILGTQWDTHIENFTSKVSYPENFEIINFNITDGFYGSTSNSLTSSYIKDNAIYVNSISSIMPENGVTLNIQFKEGAFANAPFNVNLLLKKILVGFNIVFVIILAINVIVSRTRNKRHLSIVEFYPPEDLNSAEIGYLYTNVIYNTTITSLIYYWASKGYLKIQLDESKKDSDFRLTKLKPLDDSHDDYEKILFNKIFSYGNTVTGEKLKYKLYRDVRTCQSIIKEKFTKDNRFSKRNYKCLLVGCISGLMSFFAYTLEYGFNVDIIALIVPVVAPLAIIGKLECDESKSIIKNMFSSKNLLTATGFLFIISIIIIQLGLTIETLSNNFTFIFVYAAMISMFLSKLIINKKSNYEEEVYAKILGFKDFIELAEKEKLEMMIEEDPEYFYKILPYAHALNISDKWIKKFESISIPESSYYEYGNLNRGMYILNKSFNEASNSMCSSESSSRGGGFSGGGFSGGGSGGGGGSSW